MKIVLIIIGIGVSAILSFIVYRSVAFRRESQYNSKIKFERIKSLYNKLENGEAPTQNELEQYCVDVSTREMTYQLLLEQDKTDLFPEQYYTIEKAAESNLANWLEFPTELDAIPDEVEHVEKVIIDFDRNNIIYHVFKFRVDEPHWAAKDGWMLGVVGPYFDDSKPYDFPSATFSRFSSKFGEVDPKDEAKWVHENISMR